VAATTSAMELDQDAAAAAGGSQPAKIETPAQSHGREGQGADGMEGDLGLAVQTAAAAGHSYVSLPLPIAVATTSTKELAVPGVAAGVALPTSTMTPSNFQHGGRGRRQQQQQQQQQPQPPGLTDLPSPSAVTSAATIELGESDLAVPSGVAAVVTHPT
jgi:hypothetical protein